MYRSAESKKVIQHTINSVGSGEEIWQKKRDFTFCFNVFLYYLHILQ